MHHSEQLRFHLPAAPGRCYQGKGTRPSMEKDYHWCEKLALWPFTCKGVRLATRAGATQPYPTTLEAQALSPLRREIGGARETSAAIGLAGLHRFRLAHLSERSPISPRPHRGTPLPDFRLTQAHTRAPDWPREERGAGHRGPGKPKLGWKAMGVILRPQDRAYSGVSPWGAPQLPRRSC